jgi:hypothetical protein
MTSRWCGRTRARLRAALRDVLYCGTVFAWSIAGFTILVTGAARRAPGGAGGIRWTATRTCWTCRRRRTAWSTTSAASPASIPTAEYRQAIRIQDESLIRITPSRPGPIATGGIPVDMAARLDR